MKWLQYSVLYAELKDLLIEDQTRLASASSSGSQGKVQIIHNTQDIQIIMRHESSKLIMILFSQFFTAVQDSLTYAELGDYIHCSSDPATETGLFGLKTETIFQQNPHLQVIPSDDNTS